jgi:hypothetical protein
MLEKWGGYGVNDCLGMAFSLTWLAICCDVQRCG